MKIYIQERETGKPAYGEFIPNVTVTADRLQLMIYTLKNYAWIGDNAEIKTEEFNQIFITPLHSIMFGDFIFEGKKHEVQVGCYLSEHQYKFELVILYLEEESRIFSAKYCNCHCPFSGDVEVKVLDYENYSNLVHNIGNKPIGFKQYVLRTIFGNMYSENEFDFHPGNETSYFNEKCTNKEEDFITIKGMSIYIEEYKKNYYKIHQ